MTGVANLKKSATYSQNPNSKIQFLKEIHFIQTHKVNKIYREL